MITGIGTHIKVSHFETSRKFYSALGFTPVFSYGPYQTVKEDYNGVIFEHGNCKLEIADGHKAVKPEVFQERIHSSKISLMINVETLQEILDKAEQAGIAITVPPRQYPWGTEELVIRDPDGVILVFIAPQPAQAVQHRTKA